MLFTLIVMTLLVGIFIGVFLTVAIALRMESRAHDKYMAMMKHPAGGSTLFAQYHQSFNDN